MSSASHGQLSPAIAMIFEAQVNLCNAAAGSREEILARSKRYVLIKQLSSEQRGYLKGVAHGFERLAS